MILAASLHKFVINCTMLEKIQLEHPRDETSFARSISSNCRSNVKHATAVKEMQSEGSASAPVKVQVCRGEELELQQLCFAQHGADEEALLAAWQDTLFAWCVHFRRFYTNVYTLSIFNDFTLQAVPRRRRHAPGLRSEEASGLRQRYLGHIGAGARARVRGAGRRQDHGARPPARQARAAQPPAPAAVCVVRRPAEAKAFFAAA
jgi:hypothetical protein